MVLTIVGVIVGFLVWSATWIGGNAALRAAGMLPPEEHRIEAVHTLIGLIVLSAAASFTSGLVASRISGNIAAALELGVLLLVVGMAVQYQLRPLMPAWYHALFLLLIVPAAWFGGRATS